MSKANTANKISIALAGSIYFLLFHVFPYIHLHLEHDNHVELCVLPFGDMCCENQCMDHSQAEHEHLELDRFHKHTISTTKSVNNYFVFTSIEFCLLELSEGNFFTNYGSPHQHDPPIATSRAPPNLS